MRFSDVFAASLVAPLAAAHGGVPGAPKIFGLAPRDIAMLKSRNILGGHRARDSHSHSSHKFEARQGGLNGRCGPVANGASCAETYCCSSAGYCGQGTDYCAAPDGLFPYGPANDANVVPSGGTTRNIPRPVLDQQYYGGEGIYSCLVPGTIAITYDDGPYIYTNEVINAFNAEGFKATFFITGRNIGKGSIDDATTQWPGMIQNMLSGGHQIASHTWSHQDLSAITKEQRYEQMVKNEMAIANIIGKFPTYMRPPYSSCTVASGCVQDMTDLGYVVSYFDLDTDDYNNLTPEKIQNAKDNFNNAVVGSDKTTKDFLAVAHDIHELTARNLTTTMIKTLKDAGYRGVTMGECMGDAPANWYRAATPRVATTSSFSAPPTGTASSSASVSVSATVSSTAPSSTATVSSVDGSCGGTLGYTCKGFAGGNCCSQYGWCGATDIYCGTGCNPLYGNCGLASSSSSSAIASTTVASSSAAISSSVSRSSSVSTSAAGSSSVSSSSARSSSASSSVASSSIASSTARSSTVSSTVQSSSSPATSSTARSSSSSSSSTRVSSSSVASSTPVSSTIRSSSTPVPSSTPASSTARSSSVSSTVRSSSASSTVRSSSASSTVRSSSASSTVRSSSASSTVRSSSASSTVRSSSTSASRTSSTAAATPTARVSTTGLCGSIFGTCLGSVFGNCCSITGVCGSTALSCGTLVCNPLYGNCGSNGGSASSTVRSSSSSTRTSSSASATATLKVSTNGACGASGSNQTCKGSSFGNCCSQYGWCGSTTTYCGTGCQKGFGNCT